MLEGKVVGHAITTAKHVSLQGLKLLVVQPTLQDRMGADGPPLLVVDCLGAGAGDRVMITSDGNAVKENLGRENSPVRWTVLGILDPISTGLDPHSDANAKKMDTPAVDSRGKKN